MNVLYKEMVLKKNITDVSFVILNMKKAASTIRELTRRVSFPVYQEPASLNIMGMLGGVKDDILIYDRCGLLVDHFTMPFSYLGYPFVRNSLQRVINKKSKCRKHCPIKTTVTTTQSTTAEPVTSQEVSTNTTSFLSSQPRDETASGSSLVKTEESLNSSNDASRKDLS